MKAYISQLKRVASTPAPQSPSPPANLNDRFLHWYMGLPAVSRHRRFSMSEFEAALGTQGKYLSAVLLGLGWQRKRLWASRGGQYLRYWEPPARGA